jgi:hypothetical protein
MMACDGQKVDGHLVASWSGLLQHGVDYCVETEHILDAKKAAVLRQQIELGDIDFLIAAAELITGALRKKNPGTGQYGLIVIGLTGL